VILEGLPQIMSIEDNGNMEFIGELMRKYFLLGTSDIDLPEAETFLSLKHGYVRPAIYKIHCFMNYDTNLFGMDIIFAFVGFGEPLMQGNMTYNAGVNEKFTQNMMQRKGD